MIEKRESDKILQSPLAGDRNLNNKEKKTSNLTKKTQENIDKLEKQLNDTSPKKQPHITIRKDASELIVITKARELVKYVINATRKIPKSERYTFAVRVQTLALDMMECMVRANSIVIAPKKLERYKNRYELQQKALSSIKVLEYFVAIAVEENIMTFKQFEQISKQGTEVSILLGKWCESDKRRFLAFAS